MVEPVDEGALFLAWCRGNRDAADMIAALFEASHFADDIVDGDSKDVLGDMTRMWVTLFGRVFSNRFYIAHAERFAGAIVAATVDWHLATSWQGSEDQIKRIYSYVLRETLEHVVVIAASIVDGPDHAINVRRQVMAAFHLGKQQEDVDAYHREAAHGLGRE